MLKKCKRSLLAMLKKCKRSLLAIMLNNLGCINYVVCIPPLRLKSLYMTLRQHCQPLALRYIKTMLRIFFIWVDKVDVSCKMISTPGEVSTITTMCDVQSLQPGLQCAALHA